MGAKQAKLLMVPANGQISIGKSWAGRQILVEEVGQNEIRISSGTFVPDSQKTFHTKEAQASLDAFNEWESKSSPSKESARETLNKLKKLRKIRGR